MNRKKRICLFCNDIIPNRFNKKYCSKECYSKSKQGENNPFYGKRHTEKTKRLMRLNGKGKNCGKRIKINPNETKRCKGCNSNILRGNLHNFQWNKKKYCSKDCYQKTLKGRGNPMFGKKSVNNKGIISKLTRKLRDHMNYNDWRKKVFNKFENECVFCKSEKRLEAHHKKSFSKILDDNQIDTIGKAESCDELWDVNNGQILCYDCHKSLHFDYDNNYFRILLKKDKIFDKSVMIYGNSIFISKGTEIGKGTSIEDNTSLQGCIIGRDCTIRAFSLIQKGVKLYDGVQTGSHCLIREFAVIGKNSKVGSLCVIEPYAKIGIKTAIQTMSVISEFSEIGNNVFIGPCFCNPADNDMGNFNGAYKPNPAKIGNNVRIGTNTVLKPGITIKDGTIIGIGSVICDNVDKNEVWYGDKSKFRRKI